MDHIQVLKQFESEPRLTFNVALKAASFVPSVSITIAYHCHVNVTTTVCILPHFKEHIDVSKPPIRM